MAQDVFISYSSKDKATADAVCARLEARGIRCWIAPRDVQHGANYGAAIIDAIHGSRVMVLVLSSNANASPHIPNEIERAVSHGLTILPFRIEDVMPAKSLDLFIGSVHWLDALTLPLDRHLDRLADSLGKLLPDLPLHAPARPPDPAPVPPPVPRPGPDVFKMGAAAAVVVLLGVIGWLLVGRGDDAATAVGTNVAVGEVGAPAAGVPPPADTAPSPAAARPPAATRPPAPARAASADLVGCWRWANNATVMVRADGTATVGPFNGQWRHGSGRSYTLTWPEPVDTLAMSADGNRLSGGNQYGVPVTVSRVSGGPDFPGVWQWGGVATVIVDSGGTVTMGPLTGSWALADRGQRLYRVTWPKIQESVVLSEDSTRLQGSNQYGVAVAGSRLPGCA